MPHIEVSFELDASGMLTVSAVDRGTGKTQSIRLAHDGGRLSSDEVQRMVAEAEAFAHKDRVLRERIEARNALETYVASLKNHASDEQGLGGRIDGDERAQIMEAVAETRGWLEEHAGTASTEAFAEQRERLGEVVDPITSRLYADAGGDSVEEPVLHDEL